MNKKYMQISLYVIITAVIIYCLSLVANNIPMITRKVIEVLTWFLKVIKPVILGFVFAYLMDPVICFFEKKIKKSRLLKKVKRPRTMAAVLSVVLLVGAVLGLISLLVFSVTNQIRVANFDDVIRLSEEFLDSVKAFYQSILDKLGDLEIQSEELELYVRNATGFLMETLMSITETTVASITNISSYLTAIIFSIIIGFYFIIDGRMIMDFINKVMRAIFSTRVHQRAIGVVFDIDRVFSGYIRGQVMDAFVMMILISLVLSITGVKFAIVIGIFAGIGNLIPYFGPIVAYVCTALVCLINGDISTLIVSILALIVIQFIDGNFIGPRLLSHSIEIHPLIIIISLIFGSSIGGVLGMLLAVPVGAYVKLVFVRFINNRTMRLETVGKEEAKEQSKGQDKPKIQDQSCNQLKSQLKPKTQDIRDKGRTDRK